MPRSRLATLVLPLLCAAALGACVHRGAQVTTLSPSLRVMTFNIQSGRHGLDAVARLIQEAQPDVVALQEVDRFTDRAGNVDQVEGLVRRTGLTHSHFFRTTSLHGGDYGLAVLSRYPLSGLSFRGLPTNGAEPRGVGRAVVESPQGAVSLYVTHLSNLPFRGRLREQQVRALLTFMGEGSGPALLCGDFNDGNGSAAVDAVRRVLEDAFARAGRGRDTTYPMGLLPESRLDYVFTTKELRAADAWVVREAASDHFPVVVDLLAG
jgi:endonuclease/exonuclease/phosphatase family metal-dependent hydrolase